MWLPTSKFKVLDFIVLLHCLGHFQVQGVDTEPCTGSFFTCRNYHCVGNDDVCDDRNDCGDWSDEEHCGAHELKADQCTDKEFKCVDSGRCIPDSWVCDHAQDCSDGSDEPENCIKSCDQFACKDNSDCIPKNWVCDGNVECKDGSDEANCTGSASSITDQQRCLSDNDHFICADGSRCIHLNEVCDGTLDCNDGSDEGSECSVRHCDVAQCSQKCHETPHNATCYCNDGYTLDSDEKTCTDIDECTTGTHECSQICSNTQGKYTCSCVDGYSVYKTTGCRVTVGEPILIYSTTTKLRIVSLHSLEYSKTAQEDNKMTSVAFDSVQNQLYWTSETESVHFIIRRSRLDGSATEDFIKYGVRVIEGLVIDWVGRNLYYADGRYRQIAACSLEKAVCSAIIKRDLDKPRSIIVDPAQGLLYWSDWGQMARIERAGMDGSERMQFVNTSIAYPNGLAIDHVLNRLYWVDAEYDHIESINLNGRDRKILLNDVIQHPYAMDLFEDFVYWTDWHHRSLEYCNKVTGKKHEVIAKHSDFVPMGVHIYHPLKQLPEKLNPCFETRCSDICLLAPRKAYKCACPAGFKLNRYRKQCIEEAFSGFILVAQGGSFAKFHPQAIGKNILRTFTVRGFTEITAMAFDQGTNFVFVFDKATREISALNLNDNSKTSLVHDLHNVESMAFDHFARNLYWVDSSNGHVIIFNVEKLLKALPILFNSPVSIDLDPTRGFMFVALIENSRIVKRPMDGSGENEIIYAENTIVPVSLSINIQRRRIYWADISSKNIYLTRNGDRKKNLFQSYNGTVGSLQHLDGTLFWINHRTKEITWRVTRRSFLNTIVLPFNNKEHEAVLVPLKAKALGENKCSDKTFCSHLCLTDPDGGHCACPEGMELSSDGHICQKPPAFKQCSFVEFRCSTGDECISVEHQCDKILDCKDGSDENNCECNPNQFECFYGFCIPAHERCNDHKDCPSGEDEIGCKKIECVNQFQCTNGHCIPFNWYCDLDEDCADGSDEANCTRDCTADEFKCTDGKCILKRWVCDGEPDCADSFDEKNCLKPQCDHLEFSCWDGGCIDDFLKCDDNRDCKDGSDEEDCPEAETCPPSMFTCALNGKCILTKLVCDSYPDCPDGEDEMDCIGMRNCTANEFTCSSTQCIPKSWVCDNDEDCQSGADEAPELCLNVTERTKPEGPYFVCGKDQYQCTMGDCIPLKLVCDNVRDCPDGSDEGKNCDFACSDYINACLDICIPTPTGPICECSSGLALHSDGVSCLDVDECVVNNGHCSHYCHNTKGSYICRCAEGYRLSGDGKSCRAERERGILLIGHSTSIYNASFDQSFKHIFFDEDNTNSKIKDIDFHDHYVYWVDAGLGTIKRTKRNTENTEILVSGLFAPSSISVDWIAENIYYSDKKGLGICSLKTKNSCKNLVNTYRDEVNGIAVDPLEGYLFWIVKCNSTTLADGKIYRANLDGKEIKVIQQRKIKWPSNLVIDFVHGRMFWGDRYDKLIESIDFDGEHRRTLTTDVGTPLGLALFEDFVYWYSTKEHAIVRCHRIDCSDHDVFRNEKIQVTALAALHPSIHSKKRYNPCAMVNCSHICVNVLDLASCFCPEGINFVENSTTTCEDVKPTTKLMTHSFEQNVTICSYCLNDGLCILTSDNITCRCKDGFTGEKCEYGSNDVNSELFVQQSSGSLVAIVCGLVFLVILFGLIVLFYQYDKLKSKPQRSFRKLWDNVRSSNFMNRVSVVRFKPTGSKMTDLEVEPMVSDDDQEIMEYQPPPSRKVSFCVEPGVEINVYCDDVEPFFTDPLTFTDKNKLLS